MRFFMFHKNKYSPELSVLLKKYRSHFQGDNAQCSSNEVFDDLYLHDYGLDDDGKLKPEIVELLYLISDRIKYYLFKKFYTFNNADNFQDCTDFTVFNEFRIYNNDNSDLPSLKQKNFDSWVDIDAKSSPFDGDFYSMFRGMKAKGDSSFLVMLAFMDILYPSLGTTKQKDYSKLRFTFGLLFDSIASIIFFKKHRFAESYSDIPTDFKIKYFYVLNFYQRLYAIMRKLTSKRLLHAATIYHNSFLSFSYVSDFYSIVGKDGLDALDAWKLESTNKWRWLCQNPKNLDNRSMFSYKNMNSKALAIGSANICVGSDCVAGNCKEKTLNFASKSAFQAWINMPASMFKSCNFNQNYRLLFSYWVAQSKQPKLKSTVLIQVFSSLSNDFFRQFRIDLEKGISVAHYINIINVFYEHASNLWDEHKKVAKFRNAFRANNTINEVVDFLRFIENVGQVSNKATFKSLHRLAVKWHLEIQEKEVLNVSNKDFITKKFAEPVVLNKIQFTPITSRLELFQEGKDMQHCVFSYSTFIENTQYIVFKVESEHSRGTLGVTVDSNKNKIDFKFSQAFGKYNAVLDDNTLKACHKLIANLNKSREILSYFQSTLKTVEADAYYA